MNDLYVFTIYPIEIFYKYIYLVLVSFTENYGLALFALSLLNYFLLIPLNKLVRGLQESESNIQQILAPQLQHIKETSRDAARHLRVQSLYQRYSYHPIFAIRNVLPLLVQLPFLMAVYFMLSSLTNLEGVSFLFLQNLSKPDTLFFGLNIMPLVMTLVSLVNACFVVKLSKAQKKQAVVVSLLFFILLYSAPSALLLYWTMNNVLILVFAFLTKVSLIPRILLTVENVKQYLLPSLISSSGLLLALSFIVPLYFTLGLNVNFFSDNQITHFTLFISVVFVLLIVVGIVLDKLMHICDRYRICFSLPYLVSIRNTAEAKTHRVRFSIKYVFLFAISFFCIACVTKICSAINFLEFSYATNNLIRLGLVFILLLIIRVFGFKAVNISMLSMLLFCGVQFAQNQHSNFMSSDTAQELTKKSFAKFPINEQLDHRPNIYLFYLESYTNSRTLKETYLFDNSAFEHTLNERGFQIFDNVYANTAFTKGSLLNLLMMEADVSGLFSGNSDITYPAHDIIAGRAPNLLFQFLKSKDYSISCYYDVQDYYLRRPGSLVDYTKERIDNNSYISILKDIAPPLCKYLQKAATKIPLGIEQNRYVDFYTSSMKHLDEIQKFSKPAFFLLKPPNALHLKHSRGDILNSYQTWIASGIYQEGVTLMNNELQQWISEIEKRDPDALIILLGDHGHKYVDAACGIGVLDNTLAESLSKYPRLNQTPDEYIDDLFGVFFAIKMPKNAKGKLSFNEHSSYADLFKYIFAALDDNSAFLKNKNDNISLNNKGVILRRDHRIFQHGENAQ